MAAETEPSRVPHPLQAKTKKKVKQPLPFDPVRTQVQRDDATMQSVGATVSCYDAFVSPKYPGTSIDMILEIYKRRERAQWFSCKQFVNEIGASQCPAIVTSKYHAASVEKRCKITTSKDT